MLKTMTRQRVGFRHRRPNILSGSLEAAPSRWLCGRSCRVSCPRLSGARQAFFAFDLGQVRRATSRNAYRRQPVYRRSIHELAGEDTDHSLLGRCRAGRRRINCISACSRRRGYDNDSRKECHRKSGRIGDKPAIGTEAQECESCGHVSLRIDLVSRITLVSVQGQVVPWKRLVLAILVRYTYQYGSPAAEYADGVSLRGRAAESACGRGRPAPDA